MEKRDYAVSTILSLLFTAIFSSIGNVFGEAFTVQWWLFQIWDFCALSFVALTLYKALFIPPSEEPEVPQILNAFDEALIGSKYNFCSTSTKEIALWKSSTFSYYLNLNTIKTISEKATGPRILKFSAESSDRQNFFEEGRRLLENYAKKSKKNILSKYSGIRILIYPKKIYKKKREANRVDNLNPCTWENSLHSCS